MKTKYLIIFSILFGFFSSSTFAVKAPPGLKELPPGIEKNHENGKSLPPGWETRLKKGVVLEKGLYNEILISRRDHEGDNGTIVVMVGDILYVLDAETREIIDIIMP